MWKPPTAEPGSWKCTSPKNRHLFRKEPPSTSKHIHKGERRNTGTTPGRLHHFSSLSPQAASSAAAHAHTPLKMELVVDEGHAQQQQQVEELPPEVWCLIIAYLGPRWKHLVRLSLASRQLHALVWGQITVLDLSSLTGAAPWWRSFLAQRRNRLSISGVCAACVRCVWR